MPAPSFIQEAETALNTATSPKTTASFNVLAGDVLVAFAGNGDMSFPDITIDHFQHPGCTQRRIERAFDGVRSMLAAQRHDPGVWPCGLLRNTIDSRSHLL